MVTIGMNYETLPGKAHAFQAKFASVADALSGAPGHSESVLYKNVNSESSFLIVSLWNDKQAFDDFIASPGFKAVTNWGEEHILAGRPTHNVYGA